MSPPRPSTAQSDKSTAEDPQSPATTTQAGQSSHDVAVKENLSTPESPEPKQSMSKTALVIVSVLLGSLLVSLDRNIITPAIPRISDDFNSLTDVGWYGSAYLLTFCAFQLLFGKVYTFFSVKSCLLTSIVLFEIASAICGAAPNSVCFIIGRALSGVGAAGIMNGAIVCIAHVVPLKNRPQIQGLFGATFGISAVTGPLIGGAFTSNVTWRWCFYINLPVGFVALVIIATYLDIPAPDTAKLPLAEKLAQLDALGTAILVPGVVCLVLALQWGGTTYAWSSGRIVALLTLTGVLLTAWAVVQVLFPKTATLTPRILKQRSIIAALWSSFCFSSSNFIFAYFLPIWFQTVTGVSAAESGVRLLPLLLSLVFGTVSGGFVNSKIGYYTPLAILGSCMMSIGAGLLTTLQVDTIQAKWIGYQVLYGIGLGWCFQVPNLAAQTVLPKADVPIGVALVIFNTLLGATVFVAVGENVFSTQLLQQLSGISGLDSSLITSGGVTSLLGSISPDLQETVLIAYNEALRKVFQVGLIVSCFSVLGAAMLEWKSVLQKPEEEVVAEISESAAEKKVCEVTH